MPTVVIRPRAAVDLAEIWAYIADDSPHHADVFVDLLDSKFQAPARRPGMGRRRPELTPDIRSFPVDRYVIFYVPRSRGVEIVRVLHGARDVDAMIEEDED